MAYLSGDYPDPGGLFRRGAHPGRQPEKDIPSGLFPSGIPLPGAIGASESVFLGLYMTVFPEEILSSAMLLNRGINFYLFVLVSMVVVLINIVLLKRRKNK